MISSEYDDDFDEDGDLEVDEYPIPAGLREAWAEIANEEKDIPEQDSEQ